MTRYWVVKAGDDIQDRVEDGSFVGIGWRDIGDLTGLSREDIAERVKQRDPDDPARHQTIGQLYRFAREIAEGDIVLTPIKRTRRVLFGQVVGPYRHNSKAELDHESNTRSVQWKRTDVSRDDLSTELRNTVGGLMTVFKADGHASEIERVIGGEIQKKSDDQEDEQSDADHAANEENRARERIRDLLHSKFGPHEFAVLVGEVLKAVGLRVLRIQDQPGADGGVDILAAKDVLGLDPTRVKVEVKHRRDAVGRPEIQKHKGTLSANENGLFVSLGGFRGTALQEDTPGVRLMDGDAFIALLLEHYDRLSPEIQGRLPLKRVYLPAGEL